MIIPLPRYLVAATFDGVPRLYWGADDLTSTNRLILHALHAGATHARMQDTRPDDPLVPPEERAAIAAAAKPVRLFE